MIQYQEEQFKDIQHELANIFPIHYAEVSSTPEIPLDINYESYINIQEAGNLVLTTCRKDGELIGYTVFIVSPNIHNKTCLTAYEDLYYIRKQYRKGRIGIRLFQHAEECLKKRGVKRIILTTKVHLDNSKLFEYLDYSYFAKLYQKII